MALRPVFEQALALVLVDWPALQIAVENSFGGEFSKEKAKWLVQVTADFIRHTDHGELNLER